MNFSTQRWFSDLEQSLQTIQSANPLDFYKVTLGPLALNIAMAPDSGFKKSLSSFYWAEKTLIVDNTWPTIFCLDKSLAEQIPKPNTSREWLEENHFKNKLSTEKKSIIHDPINSATKAINLINRTGVFYTDNFDTLPSWEFSSPLKELIHFIALESCHWLAHAGSFAFNGQGVLLVGAGGAGKSTTTLSAIQHGAQTVGDDYVMVGKENSTYHAYPLYKTLKYHEHSPVSITSALGKFERTIDSISKKAIFYCNDAMTQGPFVNSLPLHKIIGINHDAATDAITSAPLDFKSLIMSSFGQMPFWIDQSMKIASDLYKSVHCESIHIPMGRKALKRFLSTFQ